MPKDEITRRDFFAATADVSWMKDATADYVTARTGVSHPQEPMTDQQKAVFLTRAELAWRWRFADRMIQGVEN